MPKKIFMMDDTRCVDHGLQLFLLTKVAVEWGQGSESTRYLILLNSDAVHMIRSCSRMHCVLWHKMAAAPPAAAARPISRSMTSLSTTWETRPQTDEPMCCVEGR